MQFPPYGVTRTSPKLKGWGPILLIFAGHISSKISDGFP